jgi:hypothetical protein
MKSLMKLGVADTPTTARQLSIINGNHYYITITIVLLIIF